MQAEYDGRQIVGIDLHRRRSVIVRMTEAGEKLATVRIDNDPVALGLEIAKAGPDPAVRELELQITTVIDAHAPQLLQRKGVGPDSAAALLITAGDNPDRMNSETSFAALCGVSPIEASSGKTRRRRLNRGGDRRANAALYRIALTRSRCDQRTHDYLDRRTAQGMTRREAIRCVKRYVAREIYNLVRQLNPTTECPRTA